MKLKYFLLSIYCLLVAAASVSGRTVMPLNDDWRFRFAHQVSGPGRRVDLPHTWNTGDALAGKPDYYRGTGIYEKTIERTPEMEGKRVYLRFEGVNEVATVFVDSRIAGRHKGGYGAFVVDITDFITPEGKHTVTVKADNSLNLEIMPLVGDFNMYGGIYRDVNMIIADPLHISLMDYASPGVYLTQRSVSDQKAEVEATVVVANRNNATANGSVKINVTDGNRTVVSGVKEFSITGDATERIKIDLEIKNPHLWDGRRDPFIYTAVTEISDADGNVTDRVVQPLGLRYFSVDAENGFSLNGRPLRLHGVCRHQDRAERGNALLPAHHEEDAAIIREIGANAVRLAHYPQSEYFYSLMDEAGIAVWAEIPFIGPGGYHDRGYNDIPEFRANGQEQLRELIRQHYNHPSILFWGIFNELKTHGDNPTEYVKELNDLAHEEDPTRPTTAASFLGASDPINNVTDLIAWNQYFGWYGGSADDLGAWLDATHKAHPEFRIGLSEYGAGASIYHQQDSVKRGEASGWWHPENYQTFYHQGNWKAIAERPYVWASFVWNLFDFGAAHRTEGDRPGINDKGLVTFDRKVKKDAFYFYKANWNKDDQFVYISSRRHDRRTSATTDVTVFSNMPEVTLTVNGQKFATAKSDGYGIFTFKDVILSPGENILCASAEGAPVDEVRWKLTTE